MNLEPQTWLSELDSPGFKYLAGQGRRSKSRGFFWFGERIGSEFFIGEKSCGSWKFHSVSAASNLFRLHNKATCRIGLPFETNQVGNIWQYIAFPNFTWRSYPTYCAVFIGGILEILPSSMDHQHFLGTFRDFQWKISWEISVKKSGEPKRQKLLPKRREVLHSSRLKLHLDMFDVPKLTSLELSLIDNREYINECYLLPTLELMPWIVRNLSCSEKKSSCCAVLYVRRMPHILPVLLMDSFTSFVTQNVL